MEPVEYLRALRRYWIVIFLAIAVALAAAWFSRSLQASTGSGRTFEATAVLFNSESSSQLGGQFGGSGLDDGGSVAALVPLDPVPARVAEAIGFDGKPSELASKVTATVDQESGFLSIMATAPRPDEAKELADAFVEQLQARLVELKTIDEEEELAELRVEIASLKKEIRNAKEDQDTRDLETKLATDKARVNELTSRVPEPGWDVISPAAARPSSAIGFSAPRSFAVRAGIAAVIGLLAGAVIALVLARFDTRIRTKEVAEERFGLPVLAEVPVISRGGRREIVTATQPGSRHAEAFRILGAELSTGDLVARGNGQGAKASRRPQTVLVTSAGPSEGKTTVVANLAATFSEMGKRVLVLSADFHRPTVHERFGVPNDEGLTDALASGTSEPVLDGVVKQTSFDDILLVPSGAPPRSAGELLASDRMRTAMQEARKLADVVLLDTPPILVASDATHLLGDADAVLLVARAGKTKADLAERTTELLDRLGSPAKGVVLNRATELTIPRGYRLYYRRGDGNEGVGENPDYRVTGKAGKV